MGLDRIHLELRRQLTQAGARIDGVYSCPHDPEARLVRGARPVEEFIATCRCRRPAPGLILRAAATHKVDLSRSFMLCRDLKDIKAGRAATVETIFLTRAKMSEIEAPPDLRPHHVSVDLSGALRIIDASREAATES
jgi:histidinol phosphatase-like enzyme